MATISRQGDPSLEPSPQARGAPALCNRKIACSGGSSDFSKTQIVDLTEPHQRRNQQQVHQDDQGRGVLRVLDFYSGIGGMHHALLRMLQPQPPPQPSPQPLHVRERRRSKGEAGAAGPAAQQWAAGGAGKHLQGMRLQVTAVDINTLANRVYAAEFGFQPRTLDLQRVTAAQLDEIEADIWLLTPPCQPYTTTSNARRRDTADPRAASLLHLLSDAVLPAMQRPPTRILLENVPGFVGSDSHSSLVTVLRTAGYELREFIVSPHQLGVPYSRPRYFALALQRPLRFPQSHSVDCNLGPIEHPPPLRLWQKAHRFASIAPYHDTRGGGCNEKREAQSHEAFGAATAEGTYATCITTTPTWPGVYDAGPAPCRTAATSSSVAALSPPLPRCQTPLAPFLTSIAPSAGLVVGPAGRRICQEGDDSEAATSGAGIDPWVAYAIPVTQLSRFWRVLDVVTPSSTYCNCFTKHYTDNLLGAGSVLASEEFAARFCTRDERGRLHFSVPPLLPSVPLPPQRQQQDAVAVPRRQEQEVHEQGMDAGLIEVGSEVLPVVYRQRPAACNGSIGGGGGRRGGLGHDGMVAANVYRKSAPASGNQPQHQHSGLDSCGRPAAAAVDFMDQHQQCQQQKQELEAAGGMVESKLDLEAVVLGLRFFSPTEVAAIHGLPGDWVSRVSAIGVQPRQQYGLLGNGLSVDVASYLLQYLLEPQLPLDDLF
ncbi:hypothetical protein VaNZ11_000912 [Volvox africanus]|uniref:DNA methyltransferase n=1 Tax=Volvox africanus TaxID=51714 RepID=A0ABQ5RNL9_9CHLO|nr:hypothetical protein VaNZ11_000912 [Volvox africanus]